MRLAMCPAHGIAGICMIYTANEDMGRFLQEAESALLITLVCKQGASNALLVL